MSPNVLMLAPAMLALWGFYVADVDITYDCSTYQPESRLEAIPVAGLFKLLIIVESILNKDFGMLLMNPRNSIPQFLIQN